MSCNATAGAVVPRSQAQLVHQWRALQRRSPSQNQNGPRDGRMEACWSARLLLPLATVKPLGRMRCVPVVSAGILRWPCRRSQPWWQRLQCSRLIQGNWWLQWTGYRGQGGRSTYEGKHPRTAGLEDGMQFKCADMQLMQACRTSKGCLRHNLGLDCLHTHGPK